MKKNQLASRWVMLTGFIIFLSAGMTSCTSTKNLGYFKNLPDSTVVHLPPTIQEERIIATGDQLEIAFHSRDAEASGFFNKGGAAVGAVPAAAGGASSLSNPSPATTYLVDMDGTLEFPVLGKVKVSGLTARQLKDSLTTLTRPYMKDPLLDVKFSTFRITVLGEVRSPGSYNIPTQRTTLFEALAAAGDLPLSAKRYDIQLYRDYDGRRTITRLDMRDKDVLTNKEVFQMRPNDVLYVKPRKSSVFKEDFSIFTSIVTLVLSITTIGLTIHNNNK